MKIYLDNCCLNRPFDDLSQERVYFETEAILTIISRCKKGEWELMASSVLEYEVSKIPDSERLENVRKLFAVAKTNIDLTDEMESRAISFMEHGIKSFDSLHLAVAEIGGADVFLSTDDNLLRTAGKLELKIRIANPISWLMEVINNER